MFWFSSFIIKVSDTIIAVYLILEIIMETKKISNNRKLTLHTHDPSETYKFGKHLASLIKPGSVIALIGDLAAGKTWLAKGISYGLGVPEDEYVNSPAFDIVHEYPGRIPVFHMDFYRIDVFSVEDRMWIEEYLDYQGVVIIEWADKIVDQITPNYLSLKIEFGENENDRIISVSAKGNDYIDILEEIATWPEFLE